MKSLAKNLRVYIEEQPDEWRPTLRRLRTECRKRLPGYREGMAYGMPSYTHDDPVEVGFAKQARYLSFYVLKQPVLDAHRAELAGLEIGKSCIRSSRPDRIDWSVVAAMLTETAASEADIC